MAKDNRRALQQLFDSEKVSDTDSIITTPLGKNSVSSLKVLFSDRLYYSDVIIPYIDYTNKEVMFGDLYTIDAFHGLVDKEKNIIIPNENFFKQIPSANQNNSIVMDFVADAFNDMDNYLAAAAIIGKISRNSVFFNLKSHTNYVNPNDYVKQIKNKFASSFYNILLVNQEMNSSIEDAHTFNVKFIHFLKKQIRDNLPVTKTSIINSTNFFSFVSGLIIDIAKDKADDDSVKFNKYFNDPNFATFADACKRFGFMIDQNVPWRIIADLNSPAMISKSGNHIGYMLRYNINNSTSLFNERYEPVFLSEIIHLKDMFWKTYYALAFKNSYYLPDLKHLVPCDIDNELYQSRELIDSEKYYKLFDDSYWLRLYAYLRNYETSTGLDQQAFENIVREADNYLKSGRYYPALEYINNYFKNNDKQFYVHALQNRKTEVQLVQSKSTPDLIF